MKVIPIENAKAGTVVSEDVLNDKGNILVREGTELTESMIKKIRSLGISVISVNEEDSKKGDNKDSSESFAPLEELDKRFSNVREDPIMEEIRYAVLEYIEEKEKNEPHKTGK